MNFSRAILAGCLFLPSLAIATNGFFSHGIGTGNKAMAGAGVALPLDTLAVGSNPAGMVHAGRRADAAFALYSPPRGWKLKSADGLLGSGGFGHQAGHSEDSSKNGFLVPTFGYNHMLDQDSSIGIAGYANGGVNSDYDGTDTGRGVYGAGPAGVNWMQLFVAPSYARRISDNLSVGAGVILSAQSIKVRGVGSFAGLTEVAARNGGNAALATHLSNRDDESVFGIGFKLGILGNVTPDLALGASWQSRIWANDFDRYSDLFAENGNLEVPGTWTVGLAWTPGSRQTLAFDVQRIEYNSVDAIGNPVENLNNCNAATPENCLGGDNGAGFGWDDMTIYKLGYQYQWNKQWTWRLGYSYGKQPIPSDQLLFNILAPAVAEQHFTFGFTHTLSDELDLNFAGMYSPYFELKGNDAFAKADRVHLYAHSYELEFGLSWHF